MKRFTQFLQLQKVDVAKREVWGTAAVEQPDRAREIMDYEKSLPNFLNWSRDMEKASGGLSQGNVRAMHRDVAAGKIIHLEPRDDTKSIYIGAKIVDDNEWKKVLEGVYTGFSVGGSYGAKWPDPMLKGHTRYEAKPVEISLVDVPCMPGAQFEVIKADGTSEMRKMAITENNVSDLLKGAGMNTNELLAKLTASSDPAMQELADELTKVFPPAKKEEGDKPEPEDAGDKKKKNPFEAKDDQPKAEDESQEPDGDEGDTPVAESDSDGDEEQGAEAEEQPKEAGQPSPEQTEAIRAVVIQLLEELGFVQEQGGQNGAPTAMKIAGVESLRKRMESNSATLAKRMDGFMDRQQEITGDIAKLTVMLDEMAKRGGPAPVIRDLGSLTPELVAAEQQTATLRKMIEGTSDPTARQALQAELTRLEIKKVQTQPTK